MKLEQRELWELLPGAAGGQALKQRKGSEYFAQLGARGGAATRDRYGVGHLKELAQRGGEATRKRYHSTPRTIQPWYGGIERYIPYWPPKRTKRRKRPIYVRVELDETEYQLTNVQGADTVSPEQHERDRRAVEHVIYDTHAPGTREANQ
jgi:hypothetical protein